MSTFIGAIFVLFLFCEVHSVQDKNVISTKDSFMTFSLETLSVANVDSAVQSKKYPLPPHSVTTIHVVDVPIFVSFIVVQAHSFLYSVILSYKLELETNFFVNGTNIGLVQNISNSRSITLFLFNPNEFNITALVAVSPHSNRAPVPGGCNLEFSTYTAPYLSLNYSFAVITVDGQPAMAPEDVKSNSCDMNDLSYSMYRLFSTERDFSEDSYFEGLKSMLTPQSASSVGELAKDPASGPLLRYSFASYKGTGSIYTLIVKASDGSVSAYVPSHTFACNNGGDIDTCQILSTTFSKFICATIMFVGLFLSLLGHNYFRIELVIMGSMTGGILSYSLLNMGSNQGNHSDFVLESTFIGIAVGIGWLLIFCLIRSPMLSVLLPVFNLAFLIGSVIFFAGVGDCKLLENDANYWLAFGTSSSFIPLLFIIFKPVCANILSCSIIGGYATVLPIDYYAGTNLKYILLNVIHRATVDGFNVAQTKPPFQTPDIILSVVWGALALCGVICQMKFSKGKPPFPRPCVSSYHDIDVTTPLLSGDAFSHRRHYTPGSDNVFYSPSDRSSSDLGFNQVLSLLFQAAVIEEVRRDAREE